MPFICQQCDQPERKCGCERFCTLCQATYSVRLCEDGLYYCVDCREACDYRVEDSYE